MTFLRSVVTSISFSAALALSIAVPACSSDADATTGKRIVLETKITAGPEATAPFTNAAGWSITVTKLVIATGAFYYFDGSTIFSQRAPRPSRGSWGIKSVYAHPGHYVPGTSRGEVLSPSSVDLRVGLTSLPPGEGVTGVVRSATFSYKTPAAGPVAAELRDHAAVIEGTATKGAETRLFRAEIDASDLENTKRASAIEGCPFTETTMESDGVVTISVKLPLWFDQVGFDDVPASGDGKPVLMTASTVARSALVRGMKAGQAYVFSYRAEPSSLHSPTTRILP